MSRVFSVTKGSGSTGGATNSNWQASDQGLVAWNYDLAMSANANNKPSTAGATNFLRVYLPATATVTSILLVTLTAGATLTSGQNFAALYDHTGSLVAQTADQTTNWQSTGLMTMPLAGGPYSVAAGYLYVAFWVNGTTAPGFLRTAASTGAEVNAGLGPTTYRFANGTTATTTAPATVPTLTSAGVGYWVGLI